MLRRFAASCAAPLVLGLAVGAAGAPARAQTLETEATHALIMDYDTGIVLYSKNGEEAMPPASMSKIMTVLMAFEAIQAGSLSLDTMLTTSEHAWRTGGFASGSSTMCLEPNERVSVSDLLHGVIVLSGNDASIVLAEGMSGSEERFAADMEQRAHQLGLTSASFANATGWPDPEERISAHDLAEIARITIHDHPDLYAIYGEREFDFCTEAPSNRFNRNPVLGSVEGADGLKTGHTEESGYGLVASAERNGARRIVVFNGMSTQNGRAQEAERLLRAAFSDFRVGEPFEAGEVVGELPVYLGESATVPVRIEEGVTVGYHWRAARDATARLVYEGPIRAPVPEGTVLGSLIVEVPGTEPIERPLVAAASVPKEGLVGQAWAGFVHVVRSGDDG